MQLSIEKGTGQIFLGEKGISRIYMGETLLYARKGGVIYLILTSS